MKTREGHRLLRAHYSTSTHDMPKQSYILRGVFGVAVFGNKAKYFAHAQGRVGQKDVNKLPR